MVAIVPFDTLKMVERLENAGVPIAQARVQAAVLAEVMALEADRTTERFVAKPECTQELVGVGANIDLLRQETRADINALRNETRADISALRSETHADINALRLETKALISDSRADLVRWVVGVGIMQMALIAGLILKLLPQG